MERNRLLPFAILAAVPFIMVLGNSMLIPVFPQLESELSLNQFQVGLLVTAFSVPAGVVIPFAGAFSDHVGRKPILFPALLLYGSGGLIAGFASVFTSNPFWWILAGRIVQGIGAGGTYQIALALTGDLFQGGERTRAVGSLEAANGLGKVVSPVAGSALGALAWFAPFFAYGALAIPIAFALWFLVEERDGARKKQSAQDYLQTLGAIFRQKGAPLLAAYFAGAVGLFLLFGLLSFVSDELEIKHNLTGIIKGLVLAIPVTAMTLTTYFTGLYLQGRTNLLTSAIMSGLALTVGALIGLAFWHSIYALVGLASAMGLGIGLILPGLNTLITGATGPRARGLVTALYGTVRFFGVAIGPPAFGLAQDGSRLLMFLVGAGIAALALALVAFLIRPQQVLEEDSAHGARDRS